MTKIHAYTRQVNHKEIALSWKGSFISLFTHAHRDTHAHAHTHTRVYTRVNSYAMLCGVSICCHMAMRFFICAMSSATSVKNQIYVVVNFTLICVKIMSKLTNLIKITRIEGYNGKYGSNPHGIREIFNDLFEFDLIGWWIDDRNWEKWYFVKEDLNTISRNKKSSNLTLISRRNWRLKWGIFSENRKNEINKNKLKIAQSNDSKMKLNGKRQ